MVQLLPETKQRCYWRPKQQQVQVVKPAVISKTARKREDIPRKKTTAEKRPAGKNAVARKPQDIKKKPTTKPSQEMEYVCEPEK